MEWRKHNSLEAWSAQAGDLIFSISYNGMSYHAREGATSFGSFRSLDKAQQACEDSLGELGIGVIPSGEDSWPELVDHLKGLKVTPCKGDHEAKLPCPDCGAAV